VIGGLARVGRPFLRLAAGHLVAARGRGDLDGGDLIEAAGCARDRDRRIDCGLRPDHGRIRLHPAGIDAERFAPERVHIDLRRA
jgi:hypothetical protein